MSNKNAAPAVLWKKPVWMVGPEDRDHMLELWPISREAESKRLTLWITKLNELIQRKVDELKRKQQ